MAGSFSKESPLVNYFNSQDEKLKELVDDIGTDNWKEVAGHFSDRTDVQCLHRWQKVLNPELVKGPWTKEVREPENKNLIHTCTLTLDINKGSQTC